MIVLVVTLEMLGQVGDAFRQDRDLDFRRTGVTLNAGMFLDKRFLALGSDRHLVFFLRHQVKSTHHPDVSVLRFDQRYGNDPVERQMKAGGSVGQIGRAVQQECRDRSRMPSSA
eukprot:TRINITY_DN2514_c0_g1_i11.p1 TRINITY_DN2514_c0_g1~~TRINITY_DN2514_c0_g1_i11.p1  ORF type:complete len:114 (+),score=25.46 TRINITY_DN2514_c0_g1_i11:85-426(+)